MDEISLFYHLDSPKVRAGRKTKKLTALIDAVSSFVVESVISFLRMLLARVFRVICVFFKNANLEIEIYKIV